MLSMSIQELLKEVQDLGLTDSFSESVSSPSQPCSKWEEMPCTDIPDFADSLPDEIIDPNTGSKIMVSQSFIKRFIKVIEGELCPRRFWANKTEDDCEEESGKAAMMGNRFQYLGWGLLDYYGNIPEPILTSTGKYGVDEKRIEQNAQTAKETLERLGYEIKGKHTNMSFKCLSGELDLDCEKGGLKLITDIKYSGLIGNKWNEWSWPSDETEEFKFSPKVQAKQYLLLADLLGWERDGFAFLVFDNRANKEGEYREYVIKVNPAGLNQHKHLILHIINELQNWMNGDKFQAVPTYKGCKGCPLSQKCEHFQEFPETIEISL